MPRFWSDPANDGLPTVPEYRPTPEQVRRWHEVEDRRGVVGDSIQFRLRYISHMNINKLRARMGQPKPSGPERIVEFAANDVE